MHDLHSLIGDYYGLDWATLILGVTASFLITGGHLRVGFALNVVACVAAFCVATMSHQTGFIVYNTLLALLNMRGLLRGDRRGMLRRSNDNAAVAAEAASPQAMPVDALARVHAQ